MVNFNFNLTPCASYLSYLLSVWIRIRIRNIDPDPHQEDFYHHIRISDLWPWGRVLPSCGSAGPDTPRSCQSSPRLATARSQQIVWHRKLSLQKTSNVHTKWANATFYTWRFMAFHGPTCSRLHYICTLPSQVTLSKAQVSKHKQNLTIPVSMFQFKYRY